MRGHVDYIRGGEIFSTQCHDSGVILALYGKDSNAVYEEVHVNIIY